jgi:hypothetical protein
LTPAPDDPGQLELDWVTGAARRGAAVTGGAVRVGAEDAAEEPDAAAGGEALVVPSACT